MRILLVSNGIESDVYFERRRIMNICINKKIMLPRMSDTAATSGLCFQKGD
jgi:hypothetical protein